MEVSSIGNRIANVDPNAETDGAIRRLAVIVGGSFSLDLHGTAHRTVYAIEHDEKGIAPSLDDPAAVLLYRRVYQVPAQSPQPLERSCIVQADQTAVANHIGIDDSDQLSPILRLF